MAETKQPERLEHDLNHALTEGLEVQQNICGQDGMFLGRNLERTVENGRCRGKTGQMLQIQRVPAHWRSHHLENGEFSHRAQFVVGKTDQMQSEPWPKLKTTVQGLSSWSQTLSWSDKVDHESRCCIGDCGAGATYPTSGASWTYCTTTRGATSMKMQSNTWPLAE